MKTSWDSASWFVLGQGIASFILYWTFISVKNVFMYVVRFLVWNYFWIIFDKILFIFWFHWKLSCCVESNTLWKWFQLDFFGMDRLRFSLVRVTSGHTFSTGISRLLLSTRSLALASWSCLDRSEIISVRSHLWLDTSWRKLHCVTEKHSALLSGGFKI